MEIGILYCQMVQTAEVVSGIYNVTRRLLDLLKSSVKYMNQTLWLKKNDFSTMFVVLWFKKTAIIFLQSIDQLASKTKNTHTQYSL